MTPYTNPQTIKVRRGHGSAWRWIVLLLALILVGLGAGVPRLIDVFQGKRSGARALEIIGNFTAIKPQVDRFVVDLGGWDGLRPEHFDEARRGHGGVFDTLRTGVGRPEPPADVLTRGASPRYALEVGDFTGGRGLDHVLVLRGLREDVCQALNVAESEPPDPYSVDPGDRYARGRGCIADPDTGELVAFDVLNTT